MSYILDALKRADSERERGSIPGIHTQSVLPGSMASGPSGGMAPWFGGLALLVAALVAGALWFQFGPTLKLTAQPLPVAVSVATAPPGALPPPQINPLTAVATAPTAPTAALPPAAAAPEPVTYTPPPLPAPAGNETGAATLGRPSQAPDADAAAARAPARKAANSKEARDAKAAEPRVAVKAVPKTEARPEPKPEPLPNQTASGERIYSFNELPENVRRELPALVIGGSTYSTNPKFRMLMINGQIFQEQQQPVPNLVLEQIRQKSAVLKYKGYHYTVGF